MTSPIKSSELIRTITQQTNASLTLYTIMIDLSTFWIMRTRNQLPNHAPFSKERNHSWVLSLKAVGGTPCLLNSILGIYMCNMSCYFWGDFVIMQWKSSMKFNEEFNSSQYKD